MALSGSQLPSGASQPSIFNLLKSLRTSIRWDGHPKPGQVKWGIEHSARYGAATWIVSPPWRVKLGWYHSMDRSSCF